MKRGPNEAGLEEVEDLDSQEARKSARTITDDDFESFCEEGNLDGVNEAIKFLSMEEITEHDNLGFRLAAHNGHLNIVYRLLDLPAVWDKLKDTPVDDLFNKTQYSDFGDWVTIISKVNGTVAKRLLEIPSIQQKYENGKIADTLLKACRNGNLKVVKQFIWFSCINLRDKCLLLDTAANYGHLAIVNYLLEIEEVRDLFNSYDTGYIGYRDYLVPAIFKAAFKNHIDIVSRLLEFPLQRKYFWECCEGGDPDELLHIKKLRDGVVPRIIQLPFYQKWLRTNQLPLIDELHPEAGIPLLEEPPQGSPEALQIFKKLPNDVFKIILSKLSLKDLANFMMTCKDFYSKFKHFKIDELWQPYLNRLHKIDQNISISTPHGAENTVWRHQAFNAGCNTIHQRHLAELANIRNWIDKDKDFEEEIYVGTDMSKVLFIIPRKNLDDLEVIDAVLNNINAEIKDELGENWYTDMATKHGVVADPVYSKLKKMKN